MQFTSIHGGEKIEIVKQCPIYHQVCRLDFCSRVSGLVAEISVMSRCCYLLMLKLGFDARIGVFDDPME